MDTANFALDFANDHQRYMNIFEGNRQFIEESLAMDPEFFVKLSKGQTPKYLIIGCSDSRAPPNEITKLKPGDIFNHRNIANLVVPADLNVNSVIQYAVDHLKVKHVIVMGHTCCGGVQAALEGVSHGGMLDLWLSHLKDVYEKYEEELDDIADKKQRLDRLSELNVVEQVVNVWKNPYVQRAWKKGHPVWVHGWMFRVETGLLEEIVVDKGIPSDMKAHKFNFEDGRQSIAIKKDGRQSNVQQRSTLYESQLSKTNIVQEEEEEEQYGGRPSAITRKSNVWVFDTFIKLQSELMHRTDQICDNQVDAVSTVRQSTSVWQNATKKIIKLKKNDSNTDEQNS